MRKAGVDIALFFALLMTLGCVICYAIGFKKGQVAAIQGNIKYVLVVQANGETVWVNKSQVNEK